MNNNEPENRMKESEPGSGILFPEEIFKEFAK